MVFNIDFFSKRYIFIGISVILLLVGLLFGFINGGLNFDIQFEGGTHLEIPMKSDTVNTGEVESYVRSTFGKSISAQLQSLYSPDAVDNQLVHLIVKASKSDTFNADEINQLQEYLFANFDVAEDQRISIKTVEPYIGEEMLQKGLLALVLASLLILLYVWIRFSVISGLSTAICATLGLAHNALIVLSVYAILQLPINELFIAAVLTVVAYSINDTIIVYDRIRENSRSTKKLSHIELINTSLNQTLARSLNTDITTLMCVVTVFVFSMMFSITSLQEFCLPLIIGFIAGPYSTFCIVTQCWAMWQKKKSDMRLAAAKSAR